jgi:nucleoside-diphosphate-sugar epimerase
MFSNMPSTNPTIAITGASGFIGMALTDYLCRQGYEVVALVRNSERRAPRTHVTYRDYDITKPLPSGTLRGVDYLVHAAYVKDQGQADAFDVNVEGAKRLLAASHQAKLQRSIFLSSLSAKQEADSTYGRQKLAIEGLFISSDDVVLRLGLVVGDGGLTKQTVLQLRAKHVLPLIDGGRQPIHYIGVEDVSQAIDAVIRKKVHGRIYTIADPTSISYKEFYGRVARSLRIRVLPVPIPYWALLLLIRLTSAVGLSIGITEDNLRGLKKMSRINNAKDMVALGVHLTPLEEACACMGQ